MDLKASNERQAQALRKVEADGRNARAEVGDCQPYEASLWCEM
jgi:hypothetical protein